MGKRAKARTEACHDKTCPTPETARKLTFDPLLALYHAGTINGTHLHCADEIATAFTLLTLPVSMRASDPGREGRSDPVGQEVRWAETLEKRGKLFERYKAWRKAMKRKRIRSLPAEAVIVDRISCREVSRRYRIRNGEVGKIVQSALELYAIAAGYLPDRKPA